MCSYLHAGQGNYAEGTNKHTHTHSCCAADHKPELPSDKPVQVKACSCRPERAPPRRKEEGGEREREREREMRGEKEERSERRKRKREKNKVSQFGLSVSEVIG